MSRSKVALTMTLSLAIGLIAFRQIGGTWTRLIMIVLLLVFPFVAFDRSRQRKGWAKAALCIVAGIGICHVIGGFIFDSNLNSMSASSAKVIDHLLATSRGFVLGLLATLLLSGELFGKPVDQESVF